MLVKLLMVFWLAAVSAMTAGDGGGDGMNHNNGDGMNHNHGDGMNHDSGTPMSEPMMDEHSSGGMDDHGGHQMGSMSSGALDSLPALPVCVNGNYPLFKTKELAVAASMKGSAHPMVMFNHTLYMPDGMMQKTTAMGGLPTGMQMTAGRPCPLGTIDATALAAMHSGRVCIFGMWPMFKTSALAKVASPQGTAHSHTVGNFTLYMPDGMVEGKTMEQKADCPAGTDDQSAAMELHKLMYYESMHESSAHNAHAFEVKTTLTATGQVEEYSSPSVKLAIKAKVANALPNVTTRHVSVDVTAGSFRIVITVGYATGVAATSGAQALASAMGTTASTASDFLSTPTVTITVQAIDSPPQAGEVSTAFPNLGAIIGGSVGGTLCAIGILAGLNHLRKKKLMHTEVTDKPSA